MTIEREDDEYPGWFWAVTAEGRCGWVHRDYLRDATAPGSTLCTRPYTSLELDTEVGESLQVLDELDGWYLTRNGSAAVGWVPIATVADAGQ